MRKIFQEKREKKPESGDRKLLYHNIVGERARGGALSISQSHDNTTKYASADIVAGSFGSSSTYEEFYKYKKEMEKYI